MGHGTAGMSGIVQAYHFVGATLRGGRPVPVDGEWLVHDGPVVLCESGLHASRRPWHALQYAPGAVLCLVEVADIVAEEDDKLVARRCWCLREGGRVGGREGPRVRRVCRVRRGGRRVGRHEGRTE